MQAHKISLTPPRCIEVPVPSQESEWSCILPLSTNFLLSFVNVPRVWDFFLHFIITPFNANNIYTEGKKERRVNILGDLIFIRMFFSILIYKDKNTNLINKFF